MFERRSREDLLALVKFIAAGCSGNVVYSLVFLAIAQIHDGVTTSSVAASVISTLAVNEVHRRWTFRRIGRPSLRQAHLSGAASAVAGTVLTATALSVWTWFSPGAPLTSDVAISWCVTALVGSANFLHLRHASTPAPVDVSVTRAPDVSANLSTGRVGSSPVFTATAARSMP
ncbi:Putative flippase GtrA (transmembrane translocase of bactoprenol-linked glucose) [Quadrisphaera granulorum]|uniref:Putative flippase GtrA n=1 Tax=Quadrisphaera granulorum TaxID=317664 RepID=A0A315ZP06_9ACTN|nr:GtrA family protein [Quadrisphaera granulorum]PWJ47042.1 putative flippase GtrA [Quadrisphaera granulorum]SZE98943.1 Putative flippase GtrA (transmembrane translocase of bactoprenol-linked glucose) [Quadrisphaera granulorum]